jgi:hypothetical protein
MRELMLERIAESICKLESSGAGAHGQKEIVDKDAKNKVLFFTKNVN